MVILNVPLHLLLSPSLALSLSLFGSGALFCALHTFHLWPAFCQRFIFPIWELRSIAMIVIVVTCGRVLAHKCAHTTLEHQVHLYISKHWTPNKRESTIFAQLDYFGRSQRCLCRSNADTQCAAFGFTLYTQHSTLTVVIGRLHIISVSIRARNSSVELDTRDCVNNKN